MLSSLLGSLLRRPWQISRARKMREVAALLDAGFRLQQDGEHEQACRTYERALEVDPDSPDAHYLLGVACARTERNHDALRHLQRAVALKPDFAGAYVDLGSVHRLQGDSTAAAAAYRRAIELDPGAAVAHHNLGLLLRSVNDCAAALPHLARAHELMPDYPDMLKERALCLVQLHLFDEAIALLSEAQAGHPDWHLQIQTWLGFVHQKRHRPREAWECYERVLRSDVREADLFNNCGIVLQDLGRIDEALAYYDQAIGLQPDFPLAAFHRGLARLLLGNYARGWTDYEMRLVSEDAPQRPQSHPRWDGTALAGRTLLIYGEQGLGDEIMFASCLPQVVSAGRCVIECAPKLASLFRRSFPAATVYAATPDRTIPQEIAPRAIDVEVAAGSLPLYFRRSLEDFPAHQGYLKADPQRVACWRERLAELGPGLKVGISWQGGTHKTRSPLRSIPLERWLPILRVPGTEFVSLQYTQAGPEIESLERAHGVRITHWPDAIADYDETAALIGALDLVVSVCTAVIHLAGALGQRVWIMAPHSPEWRYGFAGDAMPWYPSTKLYRQPGHGEWEPVIAAVAADLRRVASSSFV